MTIIHSAMLVPSLTDMSATAKIPVGTRVHLSDGGVAVYMQAASDISQYAAVAVGVGYTAVNLTTAQATEDSGYSRQVGFAQTSLASSYYGWISLSGRPICNLAANCADRIQLFTTATAGVLDDATVSVAALLGVVAKTSISNATAVTLMVPSECFISNFAQQA
jgi:hypothetical protein